MPTIHNPMLARGVVVTALNASPQARALLDRAAHAAGLPSGEALAVADFNLAYNGNAPVFEAKVAWEEGRAPYVLTVDTPGGGLDLTPTTYRVALFGAGYPSVLVEALNGEVTAMTY